MTRDVNVVSLDFGNTKETEIVTENEDGGFTIFINTRFSVERQHEAYQHAMKHIENGDFEKSDVQKIEYQVRQPESTEETEILPAPELPNKYVKDIKRLRRHRRQIQKQLEEYERARSRMPEPTFAELENKYLFPDGL